MERRAVSMQIISQENPSLPILLSQNDCSSFDLLIKANSRIRELQKENQQLCSQLINIPNKSSQISKLEDKIRVLNEQLQEKALQINNLQQIHEKTVTELIKIETEMMRIKSSTSFDSFKRQLSISKIKNRYQKEEENVNTFKINNLKNNLMRQDSQILTHNNRKSQIMNEMTHGKDKSKISKCSKLSENNVLKNSFSSTQINALIKRVYSRQDENLNLKKDKLNQYRNYCANIEKKYSRLTISRKQIQSPVINIARGSRIKKSPLVLFNKSRDFNYSSYVPSTPVSNKIGQIYQTGIKTSVSLKYNHDSAKFSQLS